MPYVLITRTVHRNRNEFQRFPVDHVHISPPGLHRQLLRIARRYGRIGAFMRAPVKTFRKHYIKCIECSVIDDCRHQLSAFKLHRDVRPNTMYYIIYIHELAKKTSVSHVAWGTIYIRIYNKQFVIQFPLDNYYIVFASLQILSGTKKLL